MPFTTRSIRNGPPLFATLAIALTIMVICVLWGSGDGVEAIRLAIRMTARTSILLFACAFAAAPLHELWPNTASKWLLRNRRWLGLGFAWSHGLHALMIISLYATDPATFWHLTNIRTIMTGGFAYVFILLLAASSFDRAVLWLGRQNWSRLHRAGTWIIWASFVFTYGKRVPQSLWYAAPVLLMLVLAGLRLLTYLHLRQRPS